MNIEWNEEIRKLLEQNRNNDKPPTNGEPKPIDKSKDDSLINKDT